MNIFFRELKANLKSLVIWCVIMILLIVVGLAKFSAYYSNPAIAGDPEILAQGAPGRHEPDRPST